MYSDIRKRKAERPAPPPSKSEAAPVAPQPPPPNSPPAPPTQTIIVKNKEGCFLQTLNCGCIVIFILIGLIAVLFFFILFSPSYREARDKAMQKTAAQRAAQAEK